MDFEDFDDQMGGGGGGDEYQGADGIFNMENEVMGQDLFTKNDAVIFVIDCNKNIFIPNQQNKKSQFDQIIDQIGLFLKT